MKSLFILCLLLLMFQAFAGNRSYEYSTKISPSDYLFGANGNFGDPMFDEKKVIDLDFDIGVSTTSCGKINFGSTLKASLKNILNEKYFESMGRDILAASPMLIASYLSPTWASILKHSRIRGQLSLGSRLSACKAINSYVDSRVEDYYSERQKCAARAIARNDGNMEKAMEEARECENHWSKGLSDWAGDGKVDSNKLISSSAKWAKMEGGESSRIINLLKSLVGDAVVAKGGISIQWGPRKFHVTPRTYLMSLQKNTYSKLCVNVLNKLRESGRRVNVLKEVSDEELRELSGGSHNHLIDRQTIRSLAFMPYKVRNKACRKLTDALAMSIFSKDMNRSIDVLAKFSKNPHLPENQKKIQDRNRITLKDQIEVTLALSREQNNPLNLVLEKINEEGLKYQRLAVKKNVDIEEAIDANDHGINGIMDCADDAFCNLRER